jgi:hypothetical protein
MKNIRQRLRQLFGEDISQRRKGAKDAKEEKKERGKRREQDET